MAIAINACFCIDLFLSSKNPFAIGARRMKFYYISIILAVILISPFTRTWLSSPKQYFLNY